MKKIILASVLAFISIQITAQTSLDKSLATITSDLSQKLKSVGKKNIAVLDVSDINKAITPAGKYMADIISINLVNTPGYFQVVDRQNLDQIMKEQQLNYQGYIDATTAKQLGKILSVDAIITGTYTVLSDKITLTLKAINSETAMMLASSMQTIMLDADLAALLGINYSSPTNGINTGNKGFNGPIPTGEGYNNPATISKECETKQYGDFCFQNTSKIRVRVIIKILGGGYGTSKEITLSPGQTGCSYQLQAGVYNYSIVFDNPNGVTLVSDVQKGELKVEQCRSKTLTISR